MDKYPMQTTAETRDVCYRMKQSRTFGAGIKNRSKQANGTGKSVAAAELLSWGIMEVCF